MSHPSTEKETHTKEWNRALREELAAQNALIERMDFPPNREMWGNGIMTQIRQERLELLEKLLEFEPLEQRSPLHVDVECKPK